MEVPRGLIQACRDGLALEGPVFLGAEFFSNEKFDCGGDPRPVILGQRSEASLNNVAGDRCQKRLAPRGFRESRLLPAFKPEFVGLLLPAGQGQNHDVPMMRVGIPTCLR